MLSGSFAFRANPQNCRNRIAIGIDNRNRHRLLNHAVETKNIPLLCCRWATLPPMSRTILHVDMDAFYAAVEQRDHPEYKGKPVIVGSDPKDGKGRGIVATCSYEARKFRVHSAQPISQAWKLCPQGIYVRPDMEKYARVSGHIMAHPDGFYRHAGAGQHR